jgi:hypothetical protein
MEIAKSMADVLPDDDTFSHFLITGEKYFVSYKR